MAHFSIKLTYIITIIYLVQIQPPKNTLNDYNGR